MRHTRPECPDNVASGLSESSAQRLIFPSPPPDMRLTLDDETFDSDAGFAATGGVEISMRTAPTTTGGRKANEKGKGRAHGAGL